MVELYCDKAAASKPFLTGEWIESETFGKAGDMK